MLQYFYTTPMAISLIRHLINSAPVHVVVFISGSGLYKKSPPEGNILVRVCKCIGVS